MPFIPSQLRVEQLDDQLPNPPTGSTGGASRRIQGEIRLPPLPPPSDPFPIQEEGPRIQERQVEDDSPSLETRETFPSQGGGGGVLPPTPPLPDLETSPPPTPPLPDLETSPDNFLGFIRRF